MLKFKKIASVLASTLMVGSTLGLAAAANYPAPFAQEGAVVVYGSSAAVATTDLVAASNIMSNLQAVAVGGSGTPSVVSGGDSVKLERSATKFHLGKGILDVVSGTLTDDDLGVLLADGEYLDSSNSVHDYTQKIELGNLSLTHFESSDYKPDEPTIGFEISPGTNILNYTLDFSDLPDWDDMANTEIEVMGRPYFISSVSNTVGQTINLLDAATKTTLNSGESKTLTVGGETYTVAVQIMDSNGVIFNINGETTNKIDTGQTYKLSSGAYIGVKEKVIQNWQGGAQYVEFSIGNGKIELRNGLDVKINENTINNLVVSILNNSDQLENIMLQWNADDRMFITEDMDISMPGFDNIKLSFAGMTFPSMETFTVERGGNTYMQLKSFPLKEGSATIDLMYGNGTIWQGVGKESGRGLQTANASEIIFNGANSDSYFVATYDDGSNAESYLVRATSFITDNAVNKTTIQSYKDGSWTTRKSDAKPDDTVSLGSVTLNVNAINRDARTVNITAGSNVNFRTLYSKEGLKVQLPVEYAVANYTATPGSSYQLMTNSSGTGYVAPTTFNLVFTEESRTDVPAGGVSFTAVLGWISDNKVTVSSVSGSGGREELGDSDNFRSYVYSALATELVENTGGDQDSLKVTYHGSESYGNVYVAETGAVITPGMGGSGTGGSIRLAADTDNLAGMNLVVIGGSCVNSVASELLGGSFCGADFTGSTGVGSGQFLIETFSRSGGKVATLVAGYNAGDTTNAATYLRTQTVDTGVGKKYVGSTASSAQLQVN